MTIPPTSTTRVNPASIAQLVQSDTEASGALTALLQSEQEALKSRGHRDLEQLVREKNTHIQTLEINAEKRRHLLEQAGLEVTDEAWQRLLEAGAGAGLADQWRVVKSNFDECRRLNEINGKMIARGQQTLNQLLGLLRGHSGAPGLYTESGTTRGREPGACTIVKA